MLILLMIYLLEHRLHVPLKDLCLLLELLIQLAKLSLDLAHVSTLVYVPSEHALQVIKHLLVCLVLNPHNLHLCLQLLQCLLLLPG